MVLICEGIKKSNNNLKSINKSFNSFTLQILNSINKIYFFNYNFIKLLLTSVLIISIPSILSKHIELRKLILDNEIIVEIKGKGDQRILSEEATIPSYMELNNDSIEPTKVLYNLSIENNTIKMKWETPLVACNSMFKGANAITKINFSNFDSSQVTVYFIDFNRFY